MANKIILSLLFFFGSLLSAEKSRPVLILTIDTFKPEYISPYEVDRKTPGLAEIAKNGVVFENAYSVTAWTSPGLISVLTGAYPTVHQVTSRGKSIPANLTTVFDVFSNKGYVAEDISYLTIIANFANLGLSSYVNRDKYLNQGNDILFHYLEEYDKKRPFCLWYHHRDLHLPYELDGKYIKPGFKERYAHTPNFEEKMKLITEMPTIHHDQVEFEPEDGEWIRELYYGQILRMDQEFIQPLIDLLKRKKLWDDLFVVVTADHGEELLEHGFVGHGSTSLDSKLFEEIIHIPLIVKFPNNRYAGKRVSEKVSQIDILPTILDYFDFNKPETVQGVSVLPLLEGDRDNSFNERLLFAETNPGGYQAHPSMLSTLITSIFSNEYKLIKTEGPERNEEQFFHLLEDKEEKRNVVLEDQERVKRYRGKLKERMLENARLSNVLLDSGEKKSGPEPLDGKPVVLYPQNSDHIRFEDFQGGIPGEWTGSEDVNYMLKYRVGKGRLRLTGDFKVKGNRHLFGPFYPEMWNTLCLYNPWVFHVYPEGHPELMSRRLTFYLTPLDSVDKGRSSFFEKIGTMGKISRPRISAFIVNSFLFKRPFLVSCFVLTLLLFLFMIKRSSSLKKKRELYYYAIFVALWQFLFFTLGVTPFVWEWMFARVQGNVTPLFVVSGIGVLLALARYFYVKRLKSISFIFDMIILTILTYICLRLPENGNRFHLLIYFLMAYYLYKGVLARFKPLQGLFLSMFVMAVIGAGDEVLQFYLPTRYFGVDDIYINLIASAAGVMFVVNEVLSERGKS